MLTGHNVKSKYFHAFPLINCMIIITTLDQKNRAV